MIKVYEQVEIDGGKTTKYVIQRKYDHGLELIDVRKWILYPESSAHIPSPIKGICIPIPKWKLIIKEIEKMINESSANS